ncbi:hypothetical protein [Gordonia sp. NPDC127522]|uniref:hypothetical protein n=1 Tax=Gordonia sp. NPDC127522 TaxID=3345390 RepID=UPI00362FDDBA
MGLTTKEFAQRRPRWQWLAGAAAVVVLAAAVGMMMHGGKPSDTAETPTRSATPSSSAGKGSVLVQTPTLQRSPTDPEWLTAPPHRVSWQRVDGVPFPFSDSDGPARITGPIASGYSHTPQGAVLAAAHITFRLTWSPDYAAVIDAQAKVSATTRRQLLVARDHGATVDPAVLAQVASAPVAFKIADYSEAKASVYLAFPSRGENFRFAAVPVVWDEGDWKFSDEWDPASAPELPDSPSLSGFTSLREQP